eukprot:5098328-Ditylum_brightwellii.AAC.1
MARNDRAAVAAAERVAAAQACCEANGIVQIKRIRMMAALSLEGSSQKGDVPIIDETIVTYKSHNYTSITGSNKRKWHRSTRSIFNREILWFGNALQYT